jgi:hypothetical protein
MNFDHSKKFWYNNIKIRYKEKAAMADMMTLEEQPKEYFKLDYTIKTPEERNQIVTQIIAQAPASQLTPKYLEILADYILDALPKEEKKEKSILTDNRLVTVNKRETSYEDLVSKFENGEDGLYNLITDDKNVILTPKVSITQEDIDTIPGMKELRENIEKIEKQAAKAYGKKKYLLKKQLIEMRQDQYVLKNLFKQPIYSTNYTRTPSKIELNEHIWFDEDGEPVSDDLVSLFNPKHICAILCNYEMLSTALKYKFSSDFHYLMEDFDKTLKLALEDYPLYADLVKYKIDGKQNAEIQTLLNETYGIKHSVEYISSLWRNKIPKLIADKAKEEYILWYYTEIEKGKWKTCSRCGQTKLAHNRFFSKNKTSKDGWYSICKCCRNKKDKE